MVLMEGKVACEQVGARKVTEVNGLQPLPRDPYLHVHANLVPSFSTVKSLDAAHASYSLTLPSQRCCPCRLCLAWIGRQGLYICMLPHPPIR